jgi:hypothetical protein
MISTLPKKDSCFCFSSVIITLTEYVRCGAIALGDYTLELQAQRYVDLYRQVLEKWERSQGKSVKTI